MRGIGITFPHIPAARALFAGAALFAATAVDQAFAQDQMGLNDSAMAIPRITPRFGEGVPLPQPLPSADAALLRHIFRLQRGGDIQAAVRESASLDLSIELSGTRLGQAMLGHVLADRYLGRFSKPSADDLTAWLAAYADLPDAPAIRALLLARLPRGAAPPAALAHIPQALDPQPLAPVPEEREPAGLALDRNNAADRAVWDAARTGKPGAAERLISQMRSLKPEYRSQLRGEAGQILFTLNRDGEAYDVAAPGAASCGRDNGPGCRDAAAAGYAAGLAAWRMDRIDLARPMFEAAWRAELSTSALRAASAFWAARARLRLGDPTDYRPWMRRAAAEPATFYGFLARRTLGLGFGFTTRGRQDREILGSADIEAVRAYPAGLRAFALLQIGETGRAEAELRLLWPIARTEPGLGRAIMLVAGEAGLTDLAAQLADLVQTEDGRPRDATRFPAPRVRPNGGFLIDPAMLYAMARSESNFSTTLVSSAGATGLMQLMPETANLVLKRPGSASVRNLLHDPETNLDIGQRYVDYLATLDGIGADLIRMIASYNAGPGNVLRWASTIRDDGDPLLYIEAIPLDETHAYVPRVLTYTWIYATRMRLAMPSLDELAAGAWPRYYPRQRMEEAAARLH
jgi:soluble lytic murein transglycosylase